MDWLHSLIMLWVWIKLQVGGWWRDLRHWFAFNWQGQHYVVLLGLDKWASWPAMAKAPPGHTYFDPVHGHALAFTYTDAMRYYRKRMGDTPFICVYDAKNKEYIYP